MYFCDLIADTCRDNWGLAELYSPVHFRLALSLGQIIRLWDGLLWNAFPLICNQRGVLIYS